jgi:opacity protein-like surface antigen
MKKSHIYLASLLTAIVSIASAFAETSYRFELFGAGNVVPIEKKFMIRDPQFIDPLETGAASWKGTFQMIKGVRGGIRFGVDGQGHWGQDFIYGYGHNTARIAVSLPNQYHAEPFLLADPKFGFASKSHLFAYNVLLYPGGVHQTGLNPYLTAGVGAAVSTMSQNATDAAIDSNAITDILGLTLKPKTHVSFVFNVGAGIRYQFTKHWGVRLDGRDWMSSTPRYGIPQSSNDPNQFVMPVKGVFHQFEASVGMVYCFKSPK